MAEPKLVPEFKVDNLERSLAFYVGVLGFSVLYSRPEEAFAYLDCEGAHLMLEELGSSRTFGSANLAHPYGGGMNLQIKVSDVETLWTGVQHAAIPVILALEERWYRREEMLLGNRQFVVADPDGYLLRFFQDLGARARTNH